jgi:hypothetical protein
LAWVLAVHKGIQVSDTIQQDPAAVTPAAPAQGGNGFAVAGFITGLLPLPLFGIIFSVIGIVKSRKVGKGLVLSVIGLILALGWTGAGAYVTPHLIKASDPGCKIAVKLNADYPDSKLTADQNDPAKIGADFQAIATGLASAAGKAKNADAKAALTTYATDYATFLGTIAQGQQPDAAMLAKLDADDAKATKTCGGF